MQRFVEAGGAFVGGEEEGVNGWRTEAEALMAVVAEENSVAPVGLGCGLSLTPRWKS